MLQDKHIKTISIIGYTKDGCALYHIETKGGHHRIVKKSGNNRYITIGYGSSRSHARLMSEEFDKSIIWNDDLFKSDSARNNNLSNITNETLMEQAEWYLNQKQKVDDKWAEIYYTLKAIQYLEAIGIEKSKVIQECNKIMQKMNKCEKLYSNTPPYNEELLESAYELTYNKPFPRIEEV